MTRRALLPALALACGLNPAYKQPPGTGAGATDPGSETAAASTDAGSTSTSTSTSTPTTTAADATTTTGSTTTADATTTAADSTGDASASTGDVLLDPTCPPDPALIACYTFPPDSADQLIDGSGNGHHADLLGVQLAASFDLMHAQAGDFDGTSTTRIPDAASFNPPELTLAAFVLVTRSAVETLVDKQDQYAMRLDKGSLVCRARNAALAFDEARAEIPLAVWVHASCRFAGDKIVASVHTAGIAPTTQSVPLDGPLNQTSMGDVGLGNNLPDATMKFVGYLDHLLFLGRGLTDQELCALAAPMCP